MENQIKDCRNIMNSFSGITHSDNCCDINCHLTSIREKGFVSGMNYDPSYIESNPYDLNSQEYHEWEIGFTEGFELS
jgi:hypothetical protein